MLNMAMTSFLLRPQVPAKKTAKYESDAVVKDLTIVCQDGSFETSHVLWLQTSKLLRDRQAAFQTLNEGPRPTTDEQQPPANDGNIKEFDLSAYKMSAAVYLDRMVASGSCGGLTGNCSELRTGVWEGTFDDGRVLR
eukprot:m.429631 g.429631  ORF g.429631 m.429631 type:complete len:137 (-) comp20239_c1_seq1:420-830(-)